MKIKYSLTLLIILILLSSSVTLLSQEQLNSVIGFKIGMSKEDVISHLKELNRDYEEYLDRNEIDFKYDIQQDGQEMNIIKLYFSDEKLSKICVHFYKYNMLAPMQNTRRFQKYLDELDQIYNNDINWKGKWQSKDGSILVSTDKIVLLENMYDVLIIQGKSKK